MAKVFKKHLPKYVSCDKIVSVVSRRVGMADDADSKSVAGNRVRVQVPLPASNWNRENHVKSMVFAVFVICYHLYPIILFNENIHETISISIR